ncbi:hypothetical protein GGR57DRAFT_385126 [Xylariaceae sp. FL1272]|nr:hypothetical protein GGR57DRAFT_385126 [Xylariaceae sp. FL1272]
MASPATSESQGTPGTPGADGNADNVEKPRLTEAEKKKNHIDSEKKRREAIRAGFDELCTIVPGLVGQARSEGLVLKKTVEYAMEQMHERKRLLAEVEKKGVPLEKWAHLRMDFTALEELERRHAARKLEDDRQAGEWQSAYHRNPRRKKGDEAAEKATTNGKQNGASDRESNGTTKNDEVNEEAANEDEETITKRDDEETSTADSDSLDGPN